MVQLTINGERLNDRIYELAQIGKIEETGVCRLAHSKEDKEAVLQVKEWMEAAGMKARIDHFGNLIGRLEGEDSKAPILMIGSHIDSQPYGGRFDGVIGVLGGIEVVQTMQEQRLIPKRPIEVVAFSDEEGTRFNKGLFGSRGILGQLEEGELERTDKDGISRREALEAFGCDVDQMEASEYDPEDLYAFLELHIEQGPVLDELNEPVGIVTGISGPLWLTVELEGEAGHAGSVPMEMRHDPLAGAAEIIAAFDAMVKENSEASTVGTVGNIDVFPGSRNIIAEKVTFTVDLRDIDEEMRQSIEDRLRTEIDRIVTARGLKVKITEDTRSAPRYCDENIMRLMKEKSKDLGLNAPELMSGPFHDALALSSVCPFGMIFVRSKDGISHHPKEYSSAGDINLGTELLYQTAISLT